MHIPQSSHATANTSSQPVAPVNPPAGAPLAEKVKQATWNVWLDIFVPMAIAVASTGLGCLLVTVGAVSFPIGITFIALALTIGLVAFFILRSKATKASSLTEQHKLAERYSNLSNQALELVLKIKGDYTQIIARQTRGPVSQRQDETPEEHQKALELPAKRNARLDTQLHRFNQERPTTINQLKQYMDEIEKIEKQHPEAISHLKNIVAETVKEVNDQLQFLRNYQPPH